MIMKALSTKKKVTSVSVLVIVAVIFIMGQIVENSLQGTWISSCKIEDRSILDEIIQVGDTRFLAEGGETLRMLRSYDGCDWSEIESPISSHDIWTYSIAIFKTLDNNLGIVWEETDPDPDKKPRSTFFRSTFDGSTWSEPEILFQRDEYCTFGDAIILEDGALLLMWKEPLVQYVKDGDRTVKLTGCRVVYRAYVGTDELLVEKVIEPEDPFFCHTKGFSFVDDGTRIWCVFEHGRTTYSFYRSWSEDGKQWSEPEPFSVPNSDIVEIFRTPQGEIGILDFDYRGRDLFLLTSTDWETWSKEIIFKTEDGILGVKIAEGKDEPLWGVLDIMDDFFFIHPSQELEQKYQETVNIVGILRYTSLVCIVLLVLFVLSWMWKRP